MPHDDRHSDSSISLPTSTASLILPLAALNLSKTASSLSRASLSITNRLASIHHDSLLVEHIANYYNLPAIANERCGSWYIPPQLKAGSAYFKSTDGHQGQWSFSTRRLNLQVLDIVGQKGGCIIVDSTRRGKSMPDALSKTIPIWCAVMNALLFGEGEHRDSHLFMPEDVVSPSERSQIEERLDRFVAEVRDLDLPLTPLRAVLSKAFRPVFVTPTSTLPTLSHKSHHPIICLTASSSRSSPSTTISNYVQGAADDHEAWSHGLTPEIFWAHKDQLLSTPEDELPSLIQTLLDAPSPASGPSSALASPTLIHPTKSVYIAPISSIPPTSLSDWNAIIVCAPTNPFSSLEKVTLINEQAKPLTTTDTEDARKPLILHLPCPSGGSSKRASRALRAQLPRITTSSTSPIEHLIRAHLNPSSSPSTSQSSTHPLPKILCTCPTGTDLSVGAALVVLCEWAGDEGKMCCASDQDESMRVVDKAYVRRRLAWIMSSLPEARPSRSTLQAVNVSLMGRR